MELYEKIRNIREDKDIKQKDMAKYLHMQPTTYNAYEKGNRTIPIQHLITLSKFYGTSIDYIVGLSEVSDKLNKKTS